MSRFYRRGDYRDKYARDSARLVNTLNTRDLATILENHRRQEGAYPVILELDPQWQQISPEAVQMARRMGVTLKRGETLHGASA